MGMPPFIDQPAATIQRAASLEGVSGRNLGSGKRKANRQMLEFVAVQVCPQTLESHQITVFAWRDGRMGLVARQH